MFDKDKCLIKTVYCGLENKSAKDYNNFKDYDNGVWYVKKGNSYECLKKGWGAGKYNQLKSKYKCNDIISIKYVGEKYRSKFKRNKIHTTDDLIIEMKSLTISEKQRFLYKVLKKSDNSIDYKAFNMILLFLFNNGVKRLPICYQ